MHRSAICLVLTLVTQALFAVNAQNCALTRADVEPRNQIFFVDNNLMRQTAVPSGSRLRLACDANAGTDHNCQNGVLNPTLPNDNCGNRLRPDIPTGQAADCTAPDKLYRVGFTLNGQFEEVYRSCYNSAKVQTKYVEHTVYSNPFATNRPDTDFTTDRIISGADAATFGSKSVFNRFNALLGPSQAYVEGQSHIVIHRGHLAPSADFLFVEHKRATFKYINVFAEFAAINNGNWKTIEEWIQGMRGNPVQVKTGGIGVLSLPHSEDPTKMVPMYLGDNQKNPIPQWMFKMVGNIVFFTYNNPFATDLPSTLPCPAVNCPAIGLEADFRVGYTYCCDVNSLNRMLAG